MSSQRNVGAPTRDTGPQAEVVPMYVCAGAREVIMDWAVFPHGSSFGEMVACPAREICAWYACYDLGGDFHYDEQPSEVLLPATFKTGPFACRHFYDHAKMLRVLRNSRAKALKSSPAVVVAK